MGKWYVDLRFEVDAKDRTFTVEKFEPEAEKLE